MEQAVHADPATATFSIPAVLSRTVATLMANPGLFLTLALAACLPTALVEMALPEESTAHSLLTFAGIAISMVFEGDIAYAVFMMFKGRTAGFAESIERGMARFIPLVLCVALYLLGILTGALLLVLPGIAFWCMWEAAVPACVVEDLGPVASLKRSMDLTNGYRLHIFGLLFLTYAPYIALLAVLEVVLASTVDSRTAISALTSLATVIPTAFISVMSVTIYHTLRTIKEGVAPSALTTVFD